WHSKDIIYAIGVVPKRKPLQHLWLVYGDCYAADKDVYQRIGQTIKSGIENISDVQFSETKELGRVNKVDPLGITYLRIRGMWHIDNPSSVFQDIYQRNTSCSFSLACIMTQEKFNTFSSVDCAALQACEWINVKNVKIPNPNNPAKRLDVVLIEMEKP
ncbi:MAG: NgoPII family restriction endonuclease, partial [Mariprofundaceae bacterium]|nr:NgoPII family restriction endonuclease [Mariprofundaceae bacterium]